MQDPNPTIWGAMDRFQAHYMVRISYISSSSTLNYVTRTELDTEGHFGSKTIKKVTWQGTGRLATMLNDDDVLNEMIARQSIKDATICIEPTEGVIRIRSKWDNHLAFGITKELYEIYDRIAGHIKSV